VDVVSAIPVLPIVAPFLLHGQDIQRFPSRTATFFP
jgi:hypothetical protein